MTDKSPVFERKNPYWFAFHRLRTFIFPQITITKASEDVLVDWDVAITMRDGVHLRANIFRPNGNTKVPAIISAHPYGKDNIPAKSWSGRSPNFLYRLFPQPDAFEFSSYTSWEAPDPAVYVPRGYAVINCDLRGAGTSEGTGELLSQQERQDYRDIIEWVAEQPWCTGKVGLDGVSYLSISQYGAASEHPPHLVAICPWEGLSDMYRDLAYPGGVREIGFTEVWFKGVSKNRTKTNLQLEAELRRELDEFWLERAHPVDKIQVPMLICGSFSDHSLHTRGSFHAFAKAKGPKWLYTHRSGKWSSYYRADATSTRISFFDYFLKGNKSNGFTSRPAVRLAVYDTRSAPAAIVAEDEFPPRDLTWKSMYLNAESLLFEEENPLCTSTARFHTTTQSTGLCFSWTVPEDIDIIGPMALHVPVSLDGADDLFLFVGVRKFRSGVEINFEGSYGFARDIVTKGWQRAAHREIDIALSTRAQPVHTHAQSELIASGEIVAMSIELRQHATRFLKGDVMVLELRGNWFFANDPLRGQFPAKYEASLPAMVTVHTGGDFMAELYFGSRSSKTTDAKSRW